MQIYIYDNLETWMGDILQKMLDVIAYDSNLLIGLAGGTTPIDLYERLGFSIMNKATWAKTHFVTIDDRDVPYTDEASNYGMIKRALPDAHILHFERELTDSMYTVKAMERNLRTYKQGNQIFDLLVLGMGEDGHVASIFPGFNEEKMFNPKFLATKTQVPNNEFKDRYTLTFSALNSSKEAILLVKGKKKIELLQAFKQGDFQLHSANEFPIINVLKNVPTKVFALND